MKLTSALRPLLACLAAVTLNACATSPSRTVLDRQLPALPGYVKPVVRPEIRAGMDPKLLAAAALVAAAKANDIIRAVPVWYGGVRKDFGGK